ncbi:hypothetical protein OC846_004474 [Tilletia horrida]|uniref:J domain-containing protein n=1 Tax=Tilletia horrida TaxID=155126 RepID=A0AAN6JQD4_9BASI|nr:hypothetical protein OC846_004474 [Tilletia horrida]KAK0549436.1 hypothetical protein OC845_003141 [Tilletia horrida]KAK0561401.1 hypothetical protein OC861_005840 [Tilletia horrida]
MSAAASVLATGGRRASGAAPSQYYSLPPGLPSTSAARSNTRSASHAATATASPPSSSGTGSSSSADMPAGDLAFPSHIRNPTPYEIFHLPKTATPAQIKARYYDLVKIFHPDRHLCAPGPSSSAHPQPESKKNEIEDRFKLIVRAYELLGTPSRRRSYDRMGIGWTDNYNPWRDRGRAGWEHRGDPASGGHDRFGWQRRRSSEAEDAYFYGFAARQHQQQNQGPRYLPNAHFISVLVLITWSVAAIQYARLSSQAARATQLRDRVHLDAAHSLRTAREGAKGEEGRRRMDALRRRVREMGVLEEVRALEEGDLEGAAAPKQAAISETEAKWGIGHGGPSGKEAHQERLRRLAEAEAAMLSTGTGQPSRPGAGLQSH